MSVGYGSISITDLTDKPFVWNLLKDSHEYISNDEFYIHNWYFGDDKPQEGETVTIQIKGHLADTKTRWGVYNSGGTVRSFYVEKDQYNSTTGIYTLTGTWIVTSGSTTASNTYLRLYAMTSSQSGTSEVEWIKLERGENPTDWSPHPDDLKGSDGASITGVTNYYLATSASSGVTVSTEGWTPTIQTIDATNKYLWNYEVVYSGQTIISATTPCIIGRYGTDGSPGSAGRGITSIAEYYKATNDPTTAPTSGWSTSPEATSAEAPYLWNYERITYTDGSHEDTDARIIGTQGTSVTVSSVQYQEGTSATVQPTGTWSNTPVEVAYGNFLWTKVTYSDGKIAYSVAKQGADFSMNLLRDTAQPSRTELWVNHAKSAVVDGMMTITPTSSVGYAKYITAYLPYGDLKNKTYTFSFDAREIAPSNESYTSGGLVAYIGVQPIGRIKNTANLNSGHDRYASKTFTEVGTEWKRYSITKKIPDDLNTGKTEALVDTSCVTVQIGKSGSKWPVQIKNLKLEQAENPTPWTPNEEDLKGSSMRGVYIRDSWTDANWNTYGTVGRTGGWNNYDIDSSGTTGQQKYTISEWRFGDLFQATGTATDTGVAYTLTAKVTANPSLTATSVPYEVVSLVHAESGEDGQPGAKGDKGDPGSSLSISASALSFINYARISETPAYTPSSIMLTPLLTNLTGGGWYYKTPADSSYTAVTSGSHGITISGNDLYIAASSDLFTNSNSQITFKYQDSTGDYIDTLSVTRFTYPDATMSAQNTAITNNTNNIKLIASSAELSQFSNNYTLAEQLAAIRVATDGVTLAASRAYSMGGTQTEYVVYDTGKSYTGGDLAIYQGGVYQCQKAIASATDSTAPIKTDGTINAEYWVDVSSTYGMDKIVQNMSDFVVSADGISSVVTETKGLVDEARNLMVGTLYPDVSSTASRPHILGQATSTGVHVNNCTVAEHGFRVTNTGATRPYIRFGAADDEHPSLNGLVPGETYTMSFDAAWKVFSSDIGKADTEPYELRVNFYDDKATPGTSAVDAYQTFGTVTQANKGNEMTGRCEFTFTVPEGVTIARFYISTNKSTKTHYAAGDYIELSNIKLEVGDHATPWCAAARDLNGIDGATMVSQINQTASTVQISANHVKIGAGDTLTMSSGGVMNLNAGTMNINGATVNIGTNSSTTDAINIGNSLMGTITLDPSDQDSAFKIASADGATYFDLANSEFVAGDGGVTINSTGIELDGTTYARLFSLADNNDQTLYTQDHSMFLDSYELMLDDILSSARYSTAGLYIQQYKDISDPSESYIKTGRILDANGEWTGGDVELETHYSTGVMFNYNKNGSLLQVEMGFLTGNSNEFYFGTSSTGAYITSDTCSTKTDTSNRIATDAFVWNAINRKIRAFQVEVTKSSTSNSQAICTDSDLAALFGVTCNANNTAVFCCTANGDTVSQHIEGASHLNNGTWYALFSSNVPSGTAMKINVVAVYFG